MDARPVLLVALAACGDNIAIAGDDRLGGETSVVDRTDQAFTHPAANLSSDQVDMFRAGRGPFDLQWHIPELGPLFNNTSCLGCHGSNGRGLLVIGPDTVSQALIRVSLPIGTPEVPGGDVPVPGYGLQLQDHAITGRGEVVVRLGFQSMQMTYADGTAIDLRAPVPAMTTPTGDPLPIGTLISLRQAPPLIGLGLLEAADEDTIEALADPDDADGDGISGRANRVWDTIARQMTIGRFGWKANVATLREQVAGAFANDIGITNKVFPAPDGTREISDRQLEQAVFFTSTIAVPYAAVPSEAAEHGRNLFDAFGCAKCHVATLVTGDSPNDALAHQTIHPFTDLLLHDMGDLLADGRPDCAATGREWRTPPLWGIGLAQVVQQAVGFLHDGRARSLEEAILWHGGEAQNARESFRMATQDDRDALIAFLQTL